MNPARKNEHNDKSYSSNQSKYTESLSNGVKINVAKSAGFCSGVRRALQKAYQTAESEAETYMLGDIVHNEQVVKNLKNAGIKKIDKLIPVKNKTLLIRAHGAGKEVFDKAKKAGYKIIDATCPMVKEIHQIAQNQEKEGRHVFIIGDRQHDEVKGIAGQLKTKALIIDSLQNIPYKELKTIKKAAVVVQSTQNVEEVKKIVDKLTALIDDLKFFNTICAPTKTKQKEAKQLASDNDVMLVIGSKTSANTKRLYQICRSINKNTYWLEDKKDLNKEWFKKATKVGITSGASTPDLTTKGVVEKIKRLRIK
jgi:4-hydroxy-3-methylbut-2-enyl diphosphate reductase